MLLVFCVARYDIKGCEVSRWTEPAPEGSQIIVVLKDLNFEGQYITLGKETEYNVYFVLWVIWSCVEGGKGGRMSPPSGQSYVVFKANCM